MIIQRVLLEKLLKNLIPNKVLLLYGARRVGKTFLLNEIVDKLKEKEQIKFVTGEDRFTRIDLSSESVEQLKMFLGSTTLLIVDEAQKVPNIGLNLKLIVDHCPGIKVIASGSASFDLMQKVGEPLTGRKITNQLFPVSSAELIQSADLTFHRSHLESQLIFGSYPEIFNKTNQTDKISYLNELANSYLLRDILELDNVRNPKKILDLLTLLSFQIGSEVSLHELANSLDISKETVFRYLDLLEKSFIIFSIRGFSRNLRKEVVKSAKYYFYDLGIRNVLINNFNPLTIRNDIGELWENFLIVERIKKQKYQDLFTNNYFWRTYDQKEIDWIEEKDNKIAAFEFKWSEKKYKAPKLWQETYPEATLNLISRENYLEFIG